MKRLSFIIVSFYSFPFNGVGSLRISSLANYFAEKNHIVYFIRAANKYFENMISSDLKLNEKVNQVPIEVKNSNRRSSFRINFSFKIFNEIKKILKKEKIDFLFFCVGPFWYLPLGPIFKIFFKIPYIIDFRDIMYRHPIFQLKNYKLKTNEIEDKILEKLYVKYSQLIIDVTEENSAYHKKIYANNIKDKFITIANGYDPLIINSVIENKKKSVYSNDNYQKRIRLAISGKFAFYNPNDIEILLEIEKLDQEIAKLIEIIHIGNDSQIFKEKSNNSKLLKFHFYPQMSQIEALNIINNSNVCLLNNNQKTALGTKIFDYIALNKPIFAFVKEDYAIWKMLKNFENAFLIQNSKDLLDAINYLINNKIFNLTNNLESIEQFSRIKQYQKLENYLNKIFVGKKER